MSVPGLSTSEQVSCAKAGDPAKNITLAPTAPKTRSRILPSNKTSLFEVAGYLALSQPQVSKACFESSTGGSGERGAHS